MFAIKSGGHRVSSDLQCFVKEVEATVNKISRYKHPHSHKSTISIRSKAKIGGLKDVCLDNFYFRNTTKEGFQLKFLNFPH